MLLCAKTDLAQTLINKKAKPAKSRSEQRTWRQPASMRLAWILLAWDRTVLMKQTKLKTVHSKRFCKETFTIGLNVLLWSELNKSKWPVTRRGTRLFLPWFKKKTRFLCPSFKKTKKEWILFAEVLSMRELSMPEKCGEDSRWNLYQSYQSEHRTWTCCLVARQPRPGQLCSFLNKSQSLCSRCSGSRWKSQDRRTRRTKAIQPFLLNLTLKQAKITKIKTTKTLACSASTLRNF